MLMQVLKTKQKNGKLPMLPFFFNTKICKKFQ